jgi:hypothetical protein
MRLDEVCFATMFQRLQVTVGCNQMTPSVFIWSYEESATTSKSRWGVYCRFMSEIEAALHRGFNERLDILTKFTVTFVTCSNRRTKQHCSCRHPWISLLDWEWLGHKRKTGQETNVKRCMGIREAAEWFTASFQGIACDTTPHSRFPREMMPGLWFCLRANAGHLQLSNGIS